MVVEQPIGGGAYVLRVRLAGKLAEPSYVELGRLRAQHVHDLAGDLPRGVGEQPGDGAGIRGAEPAQRTDRFGSAPRRWVVEVAADEAGVLWCAGLAETGDDPGFGTERAGQAPIVRRRIGSRTSLGVLRDRPCGRVPVAQRLNGGRG